MNKLKSMLRFFTFQIRKQTKMIRIGCVFMKKKEAEHHLQNKSVTSHGMRLWRIFLTDILIFFPQIIGLDSELYDTRRQIYFLLLYTTD